MQALLASLDINEKQVCLFLFSYDQNLLGRRYDFLHYVIVGKAGVLATDVRETEFTIPGTRK